MSPICGMNHKHNVMRISDIAFDWDREELWPCEKTDYIDPRSFR
jgi:hypothetical protein